jgi:hypothetical protein
MLMVKFKFEKSTKNFHVFSVTPANLFPQDKQYFHTQYFDGKKPPDEFSVPFDFFVKEKVKGGK